MTNKKFKLAAMSLATAVAVSTVGPSASAVTYYLGNGDITVDQDDTRGAFSYQGEDQGDKNRTYVNEDEADKGTIYVKDGNAPEVVPPTTDNSDNGTVVPTPTDNDTQSTDASGNNTENSSTSETTTENTITVMEDVKKTEKTDGTEGNDVKIVVEGVNVDTSTQTDPPAGVPADAKEDKTIIKVGEGADVDLTVMDSNLTTGGNGIDIGVNLKDDDDNKKTNVDLTLDNTKINLTENATAGINARDNSDVDITLKGDNTIDGSEAIDKVTEGGGHDISEDNVNIEGIRVGGEGASDSSDASEGAKTNLTISGGVTDGTTEEGGSLTIHDTTGGLVMAEGSDVEITDGANVTIEETKTSGSTQAGRGVTQHGDLTISGGSSLTIDGVEDNAQQPPHTGIGIASWDEITVEDGSTLDISNTETGIYGHQGSDASLTVEDSTLNISDVKRGIVYEGEGVDKEGHVHKSAGDITFDNAKVNIDADNIGITTGDNGTSSIKLDNTEAKITVGERGYAIYGPDAGGKGDLDIANSKLDIDASAYRAYGIMAGYKNVNIRDGSVVNSNSDAAGIILTGSAGNATKLHVSNSLYNLTTRYHYGVWACVADDAYQGTPTHTILVNDNGAMNISVKEGQPRASAGIIMDHGASLIADNGIITTNGKYRYGGIHAYGNDINIRIKDNSHVDVESITYDAEHENQNLIVTGGTLTYDYKADNTLWPVNEQGDKLTNFLLTKDDAHANFDALSYNGQTYTYLSDLNKETGKQYLSVWVPAAALNYMLDVDGSHDPEIIGKALKELKQAGYKFDTAYQTAENGDQVVILRDMVVNGKSLNFTKTTDAEGNTKLIWGNYEKQAEGAPSAYDMVYGTEYEYEGKTYTIVWGYESQNNPNTTAAAGVLDAFGPDSNVKVTGDIDGTDSAQYTVTIYGALREVTDPVIPTNPEPETPEDSDPTPPAPTTPTTPAVQDARPTTPAVEQAVAKTTPAPETPVNPPVQDARPESGKLIQTGTTNWMADVLVRAGGVLLAAGYLLERKRKSMFHKAQH